MAAADSGMRSTLPPVSSSPMPVARPAGTPGWVKVVLGVLAVGVVLLGVLTIGQSGRIRELEEREKQPVLQDDSLNITRPSEPDIESTAPTDPVNTEPVTEAPTEPVPSLHEDMVDRLTAEIVVSDFVKEQLQRVENWNTNAKLWIGSETGPWAEGTLRGNLEDALENALGTFPQQEELPKPDDEALTDTPKAEDETTNAEEL